MDILVPKELHGSVLVSRNEPKAYKVVAGKHSIPEGVYTEQQITDLILAYRNVQMKHLTADMLEYNRAEAAKQAEWRASTNARRAQESADRKAYRVYVTGQVQALWTLLNLADGERATVTIGDTSIEVAREGTKLVCNL